MGSNIKNLCRLCAKKDEFSKDLMDENNKHILKTIREVIRITINGNDNLPTRICLNCEEKMVSFQLFILECYKTQHDLQRLYVESKNLEVKCENDVIHGIKMEVKDEFITEDIVSTIANEVSLSELETDSQNDDHSIIPTVTLENEVSLSELDGHFHNNDIELNNVNHISNDNDDYNYEDEDNVSIATLKKLKTQRHRNKPMTEEESIKFYEEIMKSNVKTKDLVKLICQVCAEEMKTWSFLQMHYFQEHRLSKPIVHCLCGFLIQSKSVLYKHVSEHKMQMRKLKSFSDTHVENKSEWSKYSNLRVNDFINFICFVCQKKCSNWYTLNAHSQRAHKKSPILHCSCGVMLKSKSVMYQHINDHKNPNLIQCDKCPKTAKSVAAMAKHKLRHIPKNERKFSCSSCNKTYTSKENLKSHLRSHIPLETRKIFDCDLCDVKFTTRSGLASHRLVVHERVKRYVCDLCGFACGTSGELNQHRPVHSDDKPFVCPKCSKAFKTPSNLRAHMDIHEDTSYSCHICNRVLNSRRTLRKHLLVHEDKCNHICSYCNKAFKRKQTLKVHMHTHTGDKPLSCQWCDERFAYASTLRTHRLRWHSEKMAQANVAAIDYHDYESATANTAVHEG